jgi:hypothetical protein
MTSAECRAKAAECLEAAAHARSDAHRDMLHKIAATWQRMADDIAKLDNK